MDPTTSRDPGVSPVLFPLEFTTSTSFSDPSEDATAEQPSISPPPSVENPPDTNEAVVAQESSILGPPNEEEKPHDFDDDDYQPASLRRKLFPLQTLAVLETNTESSPKTQNYMARYSKVSTLKTVTANLLTGAMALTCTAWAVWLILLTLKPNETVNWVMKTGDFDNGSFWLMVDPSTSMIWASVTGFLLVVVGYASAFVKLFIRRKRVVQARRASRVGSMKAKLHQDIVREADIGHGNKITAFCAQAILLFVKDDSHAMKLTRVCVKFLDLGVESVLLHRILEAGSPPVLVGTFSAIVGFNALSCVTMMFLPDHHSGLTEVLIDTFFDFLVAVGYPILMVIYCLSSFGMDRTKISINLEIFPDGWFERNTSVISNPVQMDIIYKALKSLQVFTALDFVLRIGVNLVFAYRLSRVADLVKDPNETVTRLYPKRHRWSVVLLFLYVVVLVVAVEESMRTSALACEPHPECAVNAHRWIKVTKGSLTQCPCLALIDEVTAPKTFTEWLQPADVTDKVVQLAKSGDLQTIKLVNRNLPVLPDELRGCKHMRHLSLVYTSTESLPDWMDEFVALEYFYVEGTFGPSLLALPDGIFDDMGSLTFIHLGMHLRMQYLPSFNGLVSLKALTLAMFGSLVEFPSFDSLANLERLILTSIPLPPTLPNLESLQKLKAFSINDRGTWCCNGFLGECNLQDPFCGFQPFFHTPPASCLPDSTAKASAETVAVVEKFSDTVCRRPDTAYPGPDPPTPERSAECGGVLYRQCSLPGHDEAMCYSARFMVISCDAGPLAIKMRRLQIEKGVGDPCNPEYEAWLGCK